MRQGYTVKLTESPKIQPVRRSNGAGMAPLFLGVVLLLGGNAPVQAQPTPGANAQTPKTSGSKQIAPDGGNDISSRPNKLPYKKAPGPVTTQGWVQSGDRALRNGDMTGATRSYVEAVMASQRDPAL